VLNIQKEEKYFKKNRPKDMGVPPLRLLSANPGRKRALMITIQIMHTWSERWVVDLEKVTRKEVRNLRKTMR